MKFYKSRIIVRDYTTIRAGLYSQDDKVISFEQTDKYEIIGVTSSDYKAFEEMYKECELKELTLEESKLIMEKSRIYKDCIAIYNKVLPIKGKIQADIIKDTLFTTFGFKELGITEPKI